MKIAAWMLGVLLAASPAAADVKIGLKKVKDASKEQAGVVKTFDGATLVLAVAEGRKGMGEMSFAVDPLTQFKGEKKDLTGGKPVVVVYTEKGGKKTARAVAFQEAKPAPAPSAGVE